MGLCLRGLRFRETLELMCLGHLTTFCARRVGNLTFVLAAWEKLNPKCKVSNDFFFFFFFLAPKSLTAINTYLDEMEEFK